nr:MAG: replication associated protein [Cressdnaviricota sp.]
MSRSRGWCFTLNNFTPEELTGFNSLGEGQEYLVVGQEIGQEGTPHLQGYVYYATLKSLKQMKVLSARAHWETAKGNGEQNRTYCIKEGHFVEFGVLPIAGKRTDLAEIKKKINEGASMGELVDLATSFQGIKMAETMMKYQRMPNMRHLEVFWYWGPTGTGKTYTAFTENPEDCWISGKGLRWWDGYSGQKTVIIDDYRRDFCTFHELLRILDVYPYRVEIKGSSMWLLANRIIITTPLNPRDTWAGRTTEELEQLLRRITIIRQFDQRFPDQRSGGNTVPPTP